MVKIHNIRLKITNTSGFRMTYRGDWYDSGRLADSYSWPASIPNGGDCDILSYERDYSLAGCSGYVQYEIGNTVVTIGFSNPSVGSNKLGVGTGGMSVWDDMHGHSYESFVVQIMVDSGKKQLDFNCKCTGSSTNVATVNIRG